MPSWITPEDIQVIREAADRDLLARSTRVPIQSESAHIEDLQRQLREVERELRITQDELDQMRAEHPDESANRPGMYL